MEYENEISDEQLDAMLRDVEIPADLKERLGQIPVGVDEFSNETSRSQKKDDFKSPPTWLALAIAASLMGIVLFFVTQKIDNSNNPGLVNNPKPAQTTNENSEKLADNLANSIQQELSAEEQELAELRAQIELQDALLARLKNERLKDQIVELNRSVESELQTREVESMIAALSSQSLIDFGGPKAQVMNSMAQVIQKYPNSRGATIAENYLKQVSN